MTISRQIERITCLHVAELLLKHCPSELTEEEFRICNAKRHGRGERDSPMEKVLFNRLFWEVAERALQANARAAA